MKDEVTPDAEEKDHGNDLGDETSNHDLDTNVGVVLCVGRGSQVTTDSLENEREQIAADEDDGVELGLETRVLSANCGDDTSEAKVDTSGEKRGSERKRDQVPGCNEPTDVDSDMIVVLT